VTAICQLCGEIIQGPEAPAELHIFGRSEDELRARALQEFDALAGKVAEHIANRHDTAAQEMTAICFLSGKVFAMSHAESTIPNFGEMREAWRATIISAMWPQLALKPWETQAAAEPGPTGADSSTG
jgi:hypothetical protein